MIEIDMKMPSCCDECFALDFSGDYPCCIISEECQGYNFNVYENRMPSCPLKEQEPREWIYCEDDSGQDGYRCSGCGFFEPWYYNYTNHDFIKKYQFCPSCGAVMKERTK